MKNFPKKKILFLHFLFLITVFIGANLNKELIADSFQEKNSQGFKKIEWEDLLPKNFDPNKIIEKYQDQIASLSDQDQASISLFKKIMDEMNNAPVNQKIKGKKIILPGYMAPIKIEEKKITAFLLVPYFGQCIHSPPPPVNQTVMVEIDKESYIDIDDAFDPYWVKGIIEVERSKTDIGTAGYTIRNAHLKKYSH